MTMLRMKRVAMVIPNLLPEQLEERIDGKCPTTHEALFLCDLTSGRFYTFLLSAGCFRVSRLHEVYREASIPGDMIAFLQGFATSTLDPRNG
jgi:hypothetical protein